MKRIKNAFWGFVLWLLSACVPMSPVVMNPPPQMPVSEATARLETDACKAGFGCSLSSLPPKDVPKPSLQEPAKKPVLKEQKEENPQYRISLLTASNDDLGETVMVRKQDEKTEVGIWLIEGEPGVTLEVMRAKIEGDITVHNGCGEKVKIKQLKAEISPNLTSPYFTLDSKVLPLKFVKEVGEDMNAKFSSDLIVDYYTRKMFLKVLLEVENFDTRACEDDDQIEFHLRVVQIDVNKKKVNVAGSYPSVTLR